MKTENNGLVSTFSLFVASFLAVFSTLAQNGNDITLVSPASALRGASALTVTFTLDTDSPPAPPAGILPAIVMIGTNLGASVTHSSQYTVTAQFNIPATEPPGAKNVTITFSTPNGALTFNKSSGFMVIDASGLAASFEATPISGSVPLEVTFTNASAGPITNQLWEFGDGNVSTLANPSHTYTNVGAFTVSLTVFGANGSNTLIRSGYIVVAAPPNANGYVVVDTAQAQCYNDTTAITAPSPGEPFYGQDAQNAGVHPIYTLGADGLTVYDNRTGLTWQRSPDTTGDGIINTSDKMNLANAQLRPGILNAAGYGGYTDWRLPTIKELYSLFDCRGTDPSGSTSTDTSIFRAFIDTNFFRFAYGDTNAGERIIDSQYASSTLYVSTVNGTMLFGVNFADGRIKGYGTRINGSDKTFFVQCVRGNISYGKNKFIDNGDQTITDNATGLMWAKNDSGIGMNWKDALSWVQARNAARYLGYSDWRLPDVKELQSIVDYTRSPDTTASASIDPLFNSTPITNEARQADFPWYWSSTTHAMHTGSGEDAAYVTFGRALGYMNNSWVDIHGAGCQRSDPKGGSATNFAYAAYGYYNSRAPQGDAIRVDNFVRIVRTASLTDDSVGDGIPNAWRAHYFGGTGTTTNTTSCATGDPDHDEASNYEEYVADTIPTNAVSSFQIQSVSNGAGFAVSFPSSVNRKYTLYYRTNLSSGAWNNIPSQTAVPGSGSLDTLTDTSPSANTRFYRLGVQIP